MTMRLISRKLWMGTHPKSPSLIPASREALASYLARNQILMGAKVSHKFGAEDGNLPFLFKVLAIEKALSIQSHPDKATAEKLHTQQPDIYKGKLSPAACGYEHTEASQIPTTSPKWHLPSHPLPRFAGFFRSHRSPHTLPMSPNYRR